MQDVLYDDALKARFWAKVAKRGPDDCWEWQAYRFPNGYGQFKAHGSSAGAHRMAYMLVVGPIPEDLQLDHLCRNKACVNPHHLEAVTQSENLRRGRSGWKVAAMNKAKTHCPRGHEYSPENTLLSNGGRRRHCRVCANARRRKAFTGWEM